MRISESILGLVFNQMCDDAEFALETPVCSLLPIPHIHAPLEPSVKLSFIRFGKVGASYKDIHWLHCAGALRETRACLMLHLKCAISPVCIFLTNALRNHKYVVCNAVDLYI